MNNDNILSIYLGYLNNINNDKNYSPTIEENTAIYNVTHDIKYSELLNKLNGLNDYDSKRKIIIEYIAEEELKKSKNEKDLISKMYGVNVENIDSVKLDNGTEVFAFYDEKLGRKRLIENIREISLVSQLKEIQNSKLEFQTNDYEKNGENILKSQAENNNNRQELKMVEIDDYINHPENYGTLDEDTREIINKLSSSKDNLKIKYFNIDNKVALTETNDILEISKTKEGDFVINEPKKWKNNVDEINNEEKVKENEKYENYNADGEDVDNTIEENDFEDEPEFISAEEIEEEIKIGNIEIDEKPEEIKDNIKKYYDNPSSMESIDNPDKKSFYERLVNEIYAVRRAEYLKKKEQKKSMVYKNPDLNNYGYVNLIFVTILLLFLAFVLFIGL